MIYLILLLGLSNIPGAPTQEVFAYTEQSNFTTLEEFGWIGVFLFAETYECIKLYDAVNNETKKDEKTGWLIALVGTTVVEIISAVSIIHSKQEVKLKTTINLQQQKAGINLTFGF